MQNGDLEYYSKIINADNLSDWTKKSKIWTSIYKTFHYIPYLKAGMANSDKSLPSGHGKLGAWARYGLNNNSDTWN